MIAVLDTEDNTRREQLSVFAHITNPDGIEEVDLVRLEHSGAQLRWTRERGGWEYREWDDRPFIGDIAFAAPDGESMPRGRYELAVEDIAGRKAQTTFEVRTLDFSLADAEFPSVSREPAESPGNVSPEFRVSPERDELRVVALNSENEVIGEYLGTEHSFTRANLFATGDGQAVDDDDRVRLYVQSHVHRSQIWLMSGPWMLAELGG